ncbi:MAG: tryptophan 7-halogenase [Gammaproteobacteria bacterium]|nr:tryptophan 7-halogenase [Gammaproteobacteria bacterium]MBT8104327.1 tryptophan 7-halogenase [Gammaproteobacteria bacterium]NNK24343.1 tryptophan 7-halogenase [Woeseiaceae bacterium]
MQEQAIKKLVIVGGGTAGWMSAALTSKLLAGTLNIELVESDAIGTVGVGEATIPPIQVFNDLAGVDEQAFLRDTKATIKLAIEFQNWGAVGDRYLHGFGYIGRKVGAVAFQHVYLKGLAEGNAGPLSDYSLNNTAARANRFNRLPGIGGTPLAGISYAYHFDAGLYAKFLRGMSEAQGVTRREGRIDEVLLDPESGNVTALRMDDGGEVSGDFFIDCSGFNSLVFNKTLGVEFEDWSEWLLCNRALAVPSGSVPESLRPYTQSIAHGAGWQWRIPLQHRTGNGHVFSDEFMSEDEAAGILLGNLEGEALKDPLSIRFTPGCRKKLWHKNCVALGLASGFIEPLESTSIHLIQIGITNLLKVFPTLGDNSAKEREYNRRMRYEYQAIRDFIILHYHLTEREDTPFWKHVKHMGVPEALQQKMAAFEEAGHLYRVDEELFTEVGWLQVMLGQGLRPRSYNALADTLSSAEVRDYLQNLKTIFAATVNKLQPYDEFIKSCAA